MAQHNETLGATMLKFQEKKLPVSVGVALGLSLTGFATLPIAAYAQDGEAIEEIVITGSLIKQADYDNANPVTVMSRDEMALTGITDVGDLIQRLPSMSGSPIGTTTNNGTWLTVSEWLMAVTSKPFLPR